MKGLVASMTRFTIHSRMPQHLAQQLRKDSFEALFCTWGEPQAKLLCGPDETGFSVKGKGLQ